MINQSRRNYNVTDMVLNRAYIVYFESNNPTLNEFTEFVDMLSTTDLSELKNRYGNFIRSLKTVREENIEFMLNHVDPALLRKSAQYTQATILPYIEDFLSSDKAHDLKEQARFQKHLMAEFFSVARSYDKKIERTKEETYKFIEHSESTAYFNALFGLYAQTKSLDEILVVEDNTQSIQIRANRNSNKAFTTKVIVSNKEDYLKYQFSRNTPNSGDYLTNALSVIGTYNVSTGDISTQQSSYPSTAYIKTLSMFFSRPQTLDKAIVETDNKDLICGIHNLLEQLFSKGCETIFIWCPKYLKSLPHSITEDSYISSIITYNSKGETLYCITKNQCHDTLVANVQNYMEERLNATFMGDLLNRKPIDGVSYLTMLDCEGDLEYLDIIFNQGVYLPPQSGVKMSKARLEYSVDDLTRQLKQLQDNVF